MKAETYRYAEGVYSPCDKEEVTHLRFKFDNEEGERMLPVQIKGTRSGTGNWSWNGDTEEVTLMPSLKTTFMMGGPNETVCHVWINGGVVKHLGDCTCGFAGQDRPLADLEE